MNSNEFGIGGWLKRTARDDTRMVTEFDESGAVVSSRPYTAAENAQADEEMHERALAVARLAFDRALYLTAAQELTALIAAQAALDKRVTGQPWERPDDVLHSYPQGWRVTHDGKTWRSTRRANIWQPPEHWTEVP